MKGRLSQFQTLINQPEEKWDLFLLSLEVCRIVDPQLSPESYLEQIKEVSGAIARRLPPDTTEYEVLNTANQVLFVEMGFQGNGEAYYDPHNSYMTSVLERRKGIPITLCILYREIVRRLGILLECVGMPGHFLLKYRTNLRELFLDPFYGGQILLPEECPLRMQEACGTEIEFKKEFLNSVSTREALLRLLMNLKQIYRHRGQTSLLLEVLERRIPLLAAPLPEILERGLARASLDHYRSALEDLEYFVEHTTDDDIRTLIETQLERLRQLAAGN